MRTILITGSSGFIGSYLAVNSIINQILIQTGSKSKVEEITGTTSFALNISKAIGAEYAPQTVKSMLSRQIEHELSVER